MTDRPASDSFSIYRQITALEATAADFVLVVLVDAVGSTPQDTGAKMIVTGTGLLTGTIGGGRVEAKAIALAQELIARTGVDRAVPHFVSWTLKGDVGMTCGGAVKLYFEPHHGMGTAWSIAIFGAGHITQALVPVLQPLPCALSVYDSRAEWIARIPGGWNIRTECVPDLPAVVDSLADDAFVLCMTQGHQTDRPILRRALTQRQFPYLGCIGSDAKAVVLRRELIADGLSPTRAAAFHCPIGLEFGTNHPHEIALSIAAQLLTERDRRRPPR